MRHRETHIGKIIACGICVLVLLAAVQWLGNTEWIQNGTEDTAQDTTEDTTREDSFTKERMHVEFTCGCEKIVRYGRDMQLSIRVDNRGEDFAGKLQVSLPTVETAQTYEKSISVNADEKKTYVMYLPVESTDGRLGIRLTQNDGDVMYRGQLRMHVDQREDTVYVGVWSRNADQLGYFACADTDVAYLSEKTFPQDWRGLDWMDVLVIDHMDMQGVGEAQCEAIVNWVRGGGVLVVADSGSQQELLPFQDTLFHWEKHGSASIQTSFGLRRSDWKTVKQRVLKEKKREKQNELQQYLRNRLPEELYDKWETEILALGEDSSCIRQGGEIYSYLSDSFSETKLQDFLQLSLTPAERREALRGLSIQKIPKQLQKLEMEGGETILHTGDNVPMFQKKTVGQGTVILSGVSLTLSTARWSAEGRQILECILKEASAYTQKETIEQQKQKSTETAQIYKTGLSLTDWNRTPNIRLYAVLFVVYLAGLGASVWYFRRKPTVRMAVWICIPVLAVSFTVLIYLLGTSTRREGPYINYLNQINLDQDGVGTIESRFRIVSGKSGEYAGKMEGVTSTAYLEESGQERTLQDDDEQGLVLNQGNGKTSFHVGEIPCFSGVFLHTRETVRFEGMVGATVVLADGAWRGLLENHFGCTLEDCVVYYNGKILYLGTLKDNEGVQLERHPSSGVFTLSSYTQGYDSLVQQLFNDQGKGQNSKCRMQRRWALLEACIQESGAANAFFYGYLPEKTQATGWYENKKVRQQNILGGVEQLPYDTSGETGIYVRLEATG